jgi:hypothetical protein
MQHMAALLICILRTVRLFYDFRQWKIKLPLLQINFIIAVPILVVYYVGLRN